MRPVVEATAGTAAVPAARRIGTGAMGSYAFGAVAYGVKDAGFGTFLLLFYNQVVGLPSATVGLVVMVALLIDAFVDPAVGFLSDRTRTRWGRRHPWMYGSALPIMVGWVLLWNPPSGWGQGATLGWLFACAVLVRTAVSVSISSLPLRARKAYSDSCCGAGVSMTTGSFASCSATHNVSGWVLTGAVCSVSAVTGSGAEIAARKSKDSCAADLMRENLWQSMALLQFCSQKLVVPSCFVQEAIF